MTTVNLAVAAPVVSFTADGVQLTQSPTAVDSKRFAPLLLAAFVAGVNIIPGGAVVPTPTSSSFIDGGDQAAFGSSFIDGGVPSPASSFIFDGGTP